MAKDKQREDLSLPWGRDPLKGLLDVSQHTKPLHFDAKKFSARAQQARQPKRKRYYSPLRARPWCKCCGVHHWIVILDDARYRDPFLMCCECKETYRMDMSVLDLRYAWRDGIRMPAEVQLKHTKHGFEEFRNEV